MAKRSESVSNVNHSTITARPPRRNEGKLLSEVKELQQQLIQVRQKIRDRKELQESGVLLYSQFRQLQKVC